MLLGRAIVFVSWRHAAVMRPVVWPWDGLWVIGLFIGIDMIFNGWSLVMLGLTAKKLPGPSPQQ